MSKIILVTVSVWPCRSVVGPGVYGMLSVYEYNSNNNYCISYCRGVKIRDNVYNNMHKWLTTLASVLN